MQIPGSQNFIRSLAVFLVVGLLGFYATSVLVMSHQKAMAVEMGHAGMGQAISAMSTDCSQARDSESCVTYHFGLLRSLSEAARGNLMLVFFVLLFALVFGYALNHLLLGRLRTGDERLRTRYRELRVKTLGVFMRQLGYWLAIFEKRDPAYARIHA